MGLQAISWRKVRALNARLGTRYVHAAVGPDGRVWCCVAHDGAVQYVDVRTGEVEDSDTVTSTSALLRSRQPRDEAAATLLAELDDRARHPLPEHVA